MEGAPLSTSDSESSFDTKKSKAKQRTLEAALEKDDQVSLRQSRHIAREALRHEEKDTEEDTDTEQRITRRAFEHQRRGTEATQLHGSAEPEHIGHVLVAAEATKRRKEEPHERPQLPTDKHIETISRAELLTFSEQVIIEGTSLRDIYETHLIGEQALRRLIAEYLHGRDIHEQLQREIVEHEIDFERDPALRDIALPTGLNTEDAHKVEAPGGIETLNQLLQKAGAGLFGDDEVAYDTTHTKHAAQKPTNPHAHHRQQQPMDIIMGIIIGILVVLVVVLYFWHH